MAVSFSHLWQTNSRSSLILVLPPYTLPLKIDSSGLVLNWYILNSVKYRDIDVTRTIRNSWNFILCSLWYSPLSIELHHFIIISNVSTLNFSSYWKFLFHQPRKLFNGIHVLCHNTLSEECIFLNIVNLKFREYHAIAMNGSICSSWSFVIIVVLLFVFFLLFFLSLSIFIFLYPTFLEVIYISARSIVSNFRAWYISSKISYM